MLAFAAMTLAHEQVCEASTGSPHRREHSRAGFTKASPPLVVVGWIIRLPPFSLSLGVQDNAAGPLAPMAAAAAQA